jgi:outer membrane protein assembly factor BamB
VWRAIAGAFIVATALAGCGGGPVSTTSGRGAMVPGYWDWPSYGHDAQHTFNGRTTLTETTVRTLRRAWLFPTGDSVTATPTVVDGTVYVGSWDDYFYAVNLKTGRLSWKTKVSAQNGVRPYPGEKHRDLTSDGGLITSSAWFEPGTQSRPALVIFGAGYTLYALDASTGAVYWRHDYTGRPGRPPQPNADDTRIFSSPVVDDGLVLFGVDTDGQAHSRGYIVGASLDTGDPVWEYQTDVNDRGKVLNDGCGNVWSSGTILPALGLVVYGTADCDFSNDAPLAIAILALHISTGKPAWVYRPPLPDIDCDWDFGATANAGVDAQGKALFLGEGGKDGTYYSLVPGTGKLRWSTNVVFGGFSGGFIATTAYDGQRVYGATAIGDFGRFESDGKNLCDPSDPRDTPIQNPSDHAFDARTGAVAWQADNADSFSPTTVAGGMTFNGLALSSVVQVRDATTGRLVAQVKIPQANWSGIATVGDALVLGLGSTYSPKAAGIEVLTPRGKPPVVPASR